MKLLVSGARKVVETPAVGSVDTIDGPGFSQFPDTRIPMFLDWGKEA